MERTKVDEVAKALAQEIVTGRTPKGMFLESEWAIAHRFDCSRHTAREATERLIGAGLVFKKPGEGLWIVDSRYWPLETVATELLAVRNEEVARGLLEELLNFHGFIMGEVAAHAATRRGDSDLSNLSFELANLERMLAYQEDPPIAHAEQELMQTLINVAGNPALIRSLRPFDVVYRRLDVQRPPSAAWISPPSWKRLIETLRAGKSSVARYMVGSMLTPLHNGVRHALNGRFPPLEKPTPAVAADAATH